LSGDEILEYSEPHSRAELQRIAHPVDRVLPLIINPPHVQDLDHLEKLDPCLTVLGGHPYWLGVVSEIVDIVFSLRFNTSKASHGYSQPGTG
jgi:hypothetical protein